MIRLCNVELFVSHSDDDVDDNNGDGWTMMEMMFMLVGWLVVVRLLTEPGHCAMLHL